MDINLVPEYQSWTFLLLLIDMIRKYTVRCGILVLGTMELPLARVTPMARTRKNRSGKVIQNYSYEQCAVYRRIDILFCTFA